MKNIMYTGAAALALCASTAFAEPKTYVIDTAHTQIVFAYSHAGYSTTTNMFSGIKGEVVFDQENPGASSVTAAFPLQSLHTGFAVRRGHFLGPDFWDDAAGDEMVTFTSTKIEVTGDNTGLITGDLSLNGFNTPVTLETTFNKIGINPIYKVENIGFDATVVLNRDDYGLGAKAGIDKTVEIAISLEARLPE